MPVVHRIATALAFTALAIGLTGCAPDDHVLVPPVSPMAGEGTPGPDFDPVNQTVGLSCQQLVSDDVFYEWGSGNFAFLSDYAPESGTSAAEIVAAGGLACRWTNLTSNETVDIAVSIPAADALVTAEADAAAAGTPASGPGTAYFHDASGTGHLDVFSGGYWLVAESTWFSAAGDAAPLVTAALAALPPLG